MRTLGSQQEGALLSASAVPDCQKRNRFRALLENVPLAELTYLVFTRMPGESYRMRLGSLLFVCLLSANNSLVC